MEFLKRLNSVIVLNDNYRLMNTYPKLKSGTKSVIGWSFLSSITLSLVGFKQSCSSKYSSESIFNWERFVGADRRSLLKDR